MHMREKKFLKEKTAAAATIAFRKRTENGEEKKRMQNLFTHTRRKKRGTHIDSTTSDTYRGALVQVLTAHLI